MIMYLTSPKNRNINCDHVKQVMRKKCQENYNKKIEN